MIDISQTAEDRPEFKGVLRLKMN